MNSGQPDQTDPDKTNSDKPADTANEPTEIFDPDSLQDTSAPDPHSTQFNPASTTWIGQVPEQFGRYKVLKTLGEGGMGAVYLAEDLQLDRRVAIKVPFQRQDNAEVLDRFRREAKSLAAIVHPNICPIHEVGVVDGVHFLSMTYVEGRPLSDYVRPDKPLPIKQAILLVRKLASALHHAHTSGIIHRDLKPANIMINKLKEPVIMDFGLARRAGKQDAVVTVEGAIMGTPAYMSPEQFAGDIETMGPGCDIYSLGVILYELLTGQRPFSGGVMEIMAKVAREDPPPPSQHRAEIDARLEAICLQALAKAPEDRFATMEEFAAVLADYIKTKKSQQASADTAHRTSRGGTIQAGVALDTQTFPETVAPEPAAPEQAAPPTSMLAAKSTTSVPPDLLESETATELPVGQGYRLVKQLGAGQYGEVWLGVAPGGIEVAIKKLLFPLGHKATQVELQALELMKRLRHSFLMQVQAYWVMEEQLMIVMELADGSLEERHAECRRETGQGIPRAELFGYMREAAEAIDFLHHEQVLHRDIKPGNILLVKGHVKVADFGIATAGVLGQDQLTTTTTTLGTPLYMAPELWNKQAGPRSDQYSLSVTYVELRLGTDLVFDAQNRLDVSMLPEKERVVVSKALAPDPRDRYESCQQFSQALDEIVESEHREAEEQRRRELQRAANQRRSRRQQVIAAAVFLACLPLALYVWKNPLWQTMPLDLTTPEIFPLTAGAPAATFKVIKVGDWGDEPLDYRLADRPDGITVDVQPVDDGAEISLQADLQHDSKEVQLTFVATNANGDELQRSVVLDVQEAKCVLPPGDAVGWKVPSDAIKQEVGGKIFYDRIVRLLPKTRTPVELVLIPTTDLNQCGTFYCMRNKVSNRLFAEFAEDQPDKIDPESQWEEGAPGAYGQPWLAAQDNFDFPVFGVSVLDAHDFAVWFGGQLPTVKQWDTAAGRYDHLEGVEGPFIGSAGAPFAADEIAINSPAGPLPVGTATRDESHFGCRDMAGNGKEWTRSLFDPPEQLVPLEEPEEFTVVFTRGQMYDEKKPLTYLDLKMPKTSKYLAVEFKNEDPLSFRCVVEMP